MATQSKDEETKKEVTFVNLTKETEKAELRLDSEIKEAGEIDPLPLLAADLHNHRKQIADKIIDVFITMNRYVAYMICGAVVIDTFIILVAPLLNVKSERLIDQKIIIALISALTVQLGAIAVIVISWLFPKNGQSGK